MAQMANNEIPINIYLDLSKEFDTLDRTKLLETLEYYGANSIARNYLTNKSTKQYVEIEDAKTEMLNISTGIPQNSILGTLLFIIYINDFNKASQMFNFIMYADDITLSSTLDSSSTCEQNGNA